MLLEPACVIDAEVTQQLLVSHCLMGVQTAQCDEDPLCVAWPGIYLGQRFAGRSCCCLHSILVPCSIVTGPFLTHMLCYDILLGLYAAKMRQLDAANDPASECTASLPVQPSTPLAIWLRS